MKITESLAQEINVRQACAALTISSAGFYRWRSRQKSVPRENRRPAPPLALSKKEERTILEILHEERFVDMAPPDIYSKLLDEGIYLCSVRTMYRILEKHDEVRERRNQLAHPQYQKPELLAERSNEIWTWDITKLKGPVKWTYFYLYVILDIFSRYVVGWMVAHREHHHSGIGFLTPEAVHYGRAEEIIKERQAVLDAAYKQHPERFKRVMPRPMALPLAVWINKPAPTDPAQH